MKLNKSEALGYRDQEEVTMTVCKFIAEKTAGVYRVDECVTDSDILDMAQKIARRRFRKGRVLTSASDAKMYLQNLMASCDREMFGVLFLDSQHRVIKFEADLFKGTVNAAAIYPREIVKRALELVSCAVLVVHNHPSGNPNPSTADISVTKDIKNALGLVDITLLDHIVVGNEGAVSLAEQGLM